MSQRIRFQLLAIVVFIGITATVIPLSMAQEEEELLPTPRICKEKVLPYVQEEFKGLSSFMEQHFQNEASNRELLTDAVKRLKQFELRITRYLNEIFIVKEGEVTRDALEAYQKCANIVTDVQVQARDIFKNSVVSNASAKKTIALLRKYKEINSKLRKLNQDIGFLAGRLNTFNAKVPCYIERCVR